LFRTRRAVLVLGVLLASSLLAGGVAAQSAFSVAGELPTGELTRGSANPILRNDSSYDGIKAGPSTVTKFAAGD
jgi:hypothetical protein